MWYTKHYWLVVQWKVSKNVVAIQSWWKTKEWCIQQTWSLFASVFIFSLGAIFCRRQERAMYSMRKCTNRWMRLIASAILLSSSSVSVRTLDPNEASNNARNRFSIYQCEKRRYLSSLILHSLALYRLISDWTIQDMTRWHLRSDYQQKMPARKMGHMAIRHIQDTPTSIQSIHRIKHERQS